MVNFKFFQAISPLSPITNKWLSLQHGFTDTLVLKGSDRATRSELEPFIYTVELLWQSKGTCHLHSVLLQPTELWVCNFRIQNIMPSSALGSSHGCSLCFPAFRILMLKLIYEDIPCSDGDMAAGHARATYSLMHLFIQAVWPLPTPTFPFSTYQLEPSDTHTHTMISAGKEEKREQMHFRKRTGNRHWNGHYQALQFHLWFQLLQQGYAMNVAWLP